MTTNEFLEYYSSNKYVKQPSVSAPTSRFLNTDLIKDERSYGKNVFRLSYQCLLNIEASYIVKHRVLSEVVEKEYPKLFTDEEVWSGKDEFPGLSALTLDKCVEVLIDPEVESVLERPNMILPEIVAKEFPTLKNWWIAAVERFLAESLLFYKTACLRLPFEKTPNECARLLNLSVDDINAFEAQVSTIVLDAIDEQTEAQSSLLDDRRYIQQRFGVPS